MKLGIVGIGLIGSSLARAFRTYGVATEIAIYDNLAQHMEEAQALQLGTTYCTSLQELAEQSDIVFVCTPLPTISATIKYIAPYLKDGAIVTDVGSVKSSIIADLTEMSPHVSYVPGHPIAGTEHAGPASGTADLFKGKTYIIIAPPEGPSPAAQRTAAIVEKIGATAVYTTAEQHDLTLGYISHLPHVIAYAAMNGTEHLTASLGFNPALHAGNSFNDMTRVAASKTPMWCDIFRMNKDHILTAAKAMRGEMDILITALEKDDGTEISARLEQGRAIKLKLLEEVKAKQ